MWRVKKAIAPEQVQHNSIQKNVASVAALSTFWLAWDLNLKPSILEMNGFKASLLHQLTSLTKSIIKFRDYTPKILSPKIHAEFKKKKRIKRRMSTICMRFSQNNTEVFGFLAPTTLFLATQNFLIRIINSTQ